MEISWDVCVFHSTQCDFPSGSCWDGNRQMKNKQDIHRVTVNGIGTDRVAKRGGEQMAIAELSERKRLEVEVVRCHHELYGDLEWNVKLGLGRVGVLVLQFVEKVLTHILQTDSRHGKQLDPSGTCFQKPT